MTIVGVFVKIISSPDEELFSEIYIGCTTLYFVYILLCSRWFCIPPLLRQCIVIFVVAEGWLLLDIEWFILFSNIDHVVQVIYIESSGKIWSPLDIYQPQ